MFTRMESAAKVATAAFDEVWGFLGDSVSDSILVRTNLVARCMDKGPPSNPRIRRKVTKRANDFTRKV